MLYKLAARCRGEVPDDDSKEFTHGASSTAGTDKDDGFRPAKLFSIDRVFRNETMDATHLAEFHQVEGVVADRNLTLADLIGWSSFKQGDILLTLPRFHESLLQQDGNRKSTLQACIQPLHGGASSRFASYSALDQSS